MSVHPLDKASVRATSKFFMSMSDGRVEGGEASRVCAIVQSQPGETGLLAYPPAPSLAPPASTPTFTTSPPAFLASRLRSSRSVAATAPASLHNLWKPPTITTC